VSPKTSAATVSHGSIDYIFPENTILPGGGFAVVARSPADIEQTYGISRVYGPWLGAETKQVGKRRAP
jgi:hypothetical protein